MERYRVAENHESKKVETKLLSLHRRAEKGNEEAVRELFQLVRYNPTAAELVAGNLELGTIECGIAGNKRWTLAHEAMGYGPAARMVCRRHPNAASKIIDSYGWSVLQEARNRLAD